MITRDGVELHLHSWTGDRPVAMLLILHGYGEHAGRYAHVGQAFAARNISTFAVDLRGHGKSKGTRGHVSRFSEYHQDATALLEHVRQEARSAGGVPIFLYGHSMGGLLSIDWLLSGAGKDLRGLLLTSPFLGVALAVSPIKTALGKVMSNIWPTLALPAGIKGHHVTRDPELAELYDKDPLNNKNATARWYTEAMSTVDKVIDRGSELNLPILLLYGGADQVASADRTDRFVKGLSGGKDRTAERMPGYSHELVNEPPDMRRAIIERMAGWIAERATTRAGAETR